MEYISEFCVSHSRVDEDLNLLGHDALSVRN